MMMIETRDEQDVMAGAASTARKQLSVSSSLLESDLKKRPGVCSLLHTLLQAICVVCIGLESLARWEMCTGRLTHRMLLLGCGFVVSSFCVFCSFTIQLQLLYRPSVRSTEVVGTYLL